MKTRQSNYIDRVGAYQCCRIATVFSLIGWLASGAQTAIFVVHAIVAIFMPEMMRYSVVGLVLSSVATMSSISAMILGNFAKAKDKKLSMACAVLSVFSATLALCSLNHPYVGVFFPVVLPITFSGIFNLLATVLYANYWAKAPSDADEMRAYNDMPLDERKDRDSKDTKKFLLTVLVTLLAFGITVSAVIPTEYFRNCNIVYNHMVYDMGHERLLSSSKISLDRYLKALPEGYRDTDKIKDDYQIYKKLENELSDSITGVEARDALGKMYELKKADDRWNFARNYKETRLYCDAVWQCGDYSLTVGQLSEREEVQEFSTNFPYWHPEFAEEIDEITVVGTYRRYYRGSHIVRSYEWIFGYNVCYEYDGESREFSTDVCRIDSISYSVEDEEFVLRVYCYETGKYYEMKLAE